MELQAAGSKKANGTTVNSKGQSVDEAVHNLNMALREVYQPGDLALVC